MCVIRSPRGVPEEPLGPRLDFLRQTALRPYHVVVSESFEPRLKEAIHGIPFGRNIARDDPEGSSPTGTPRGVT